MESGLKILFFEDKRLPYIRFNMFFLKAGSNYDPPNKKGVAKITSDLLDQGAGGLSSEELQQQLNHYGIAFNSNVGRDILSLSLMGLSWHAPKIWDLFLKISTESHLDEKEFKLLKTKSIATRKTDLEDASSLAYEAWRNQFFSKKDPAYGSVTGTVDSLKKITLGDVKDFYLKNYKKNKPILVVLGQFDKELKKKIIASMEQKFNELDDSHPVLDINLKDKNSFTLLTKNSSVQSQIIIGFSSTPFLKNKPDIHAAIALANFVLGGGSSGRLYKRLRGDQGLTYGVYSMQYPLKRYGLFIILGSTKTKTTAQFLSETLSILKTFQEKGITAQELQIAKSVLKIRHLKSIETPSSKASKIIRYKYHLEASTSLFIDQYDAILGKVTLEQVNQVIKKYFVSENLNVLVYGHPSSKADLLVFNSPDKNQEDLKKDVSKNDSQAKSNTLISDSSKIKLAPLKVITFKDVFSKELTSK